MKTKIFENHELPLVAIEPHYGGPYLVGLVRITKNWYIVRCNELCSSRFSRKAGEPAYSAGAFKYRWSLTPSEFVSVKEAEELAEKHGGTWDSGWKPKKSEK